jgi:hypothetical protein
VRHPWPYASATSLLGCLARINVLTRQDVVKLRVTDSCLVDYSDYKNRPDEKADASLFRLHPGELALAYHQKSWWPPCFESFARFFLTPLRYCPECIHQGYHTLLFQLPWWRQCPIHRTALTRCCPRCRGELTGLRFDAEPARAFHCVRCQLDLANSGAIVNATRDAIPGCLHRVRAVHTRWARQLTSRFVVTPSILDQHVALSDAKVMQFIGAADVPWPAELEPLVVPLAEARAERFELTITRHVGTTEPLCDLLGLSEDLAKAKSEEAPHRHFPLTWEQTNYMLRLERRLQNASGVRVPRLLRDWQHSYRQRRLPKWNPPNWSSRSFPDASGIRDRGYRRRDQFVSVGPGVLGITKFETSRSELSNLSAFRALRVLQERLGGGSNSPDNGAEREVFDWWYSHLLATSLVDGTIAATHAVSWMVPDSPEPHVLPGWPPVDVDRHAPGHIWCLAATRSGVSLTAYLVPIPLERLVRKDQEWRRDLINGLLVTTFMSQGDARDVDPPPSRENQTSAPPIRQNSMPDEFAWRFKGLPKP